MVQRSRTLYSPKSSPMFTNSGIEVRFQKMWLPIILVEIGNIYVCHTGSGINSQQCCYGNKLVKYVKYLENSESDVTSTSTEVLYRTPLVNFTLTL